MARSSIRSAWLAAAAAAVGLGLAACGGGGSSSPGTPVIAIPPGRATSSLLVVFLPGTNGTPAGVSQFLNVSANAGALITSLPVADPHVSTIGDGVTPLDASGMPLFAPAWRYLLGL